MPEMIKESETVELKRSTSELKEAIISIVAILNKHGRGELFFGFRNDGVAVGQQVTENTLREISRTISESIEPKIYPKIEALVLSDNPCVKIEFEGSDVPYFAEGRAYIRVADENRRISPQELKKMIVLKNIVNWDSEICRKASLKDIHEGKVRKFLKMAGLRFDDKKNALAKLGILKEDGIQNAAIIIFGKKPQDFFNSAKLRCAVFAKEDTSMILDRQEYSGDLFYLIEQAEEYVKKNIHIGMRIEGLYRIDVPEIDPEAMREAIINAFCHRDYRELDSVNIAIFKDRVEVRSPGLLYGGLTIESITKESVSERRNVLIAEMFHRVHFVERWGRGIELILCCVA
jgi:ATP-dependent DNA helicase RecG